MGAVFEPDELSILRSLLGQLIELLCDGQPTSATQVAAEQDFFDRLERELGLVDEQWAANDFYFEPDPVLTRLFPRAYPHDEHANDEFSRYTQPALLADKVDCAQLMLADLCPLDDGCCAIPDDHFEAWFKSLTNLRLSLAVRLDIDTVEDAERLAELPDDDPVALIYGIYEWLGWVQECLLGACEA